MRYKNGRSAAKSGRIRDDAAVFLSRGRDKKLFRAMLASLGVDEKTSAHDACEMEHAVSPESSAALQRLLPGNKYKGEENQ